MSESYLHHKLKQVGLRWVRSVGCVAFACEVRWGWMGIADVIGVKENGDVYLVEAKASTSDLRSDAKAGKKLYKLQNSKDIDFVYYIITTGVNTDVLPIWIGLLDEHGRVQRRAKRLDRSRTPAIRLCHMGRIARACSWRAYGHVIRHEQEQPEFSLL